jgi:RNA polymerase sigma-70 factor, ECF subfamily
MRRREFEQLAKRYQRDIFAAALRLTDNYADAEDLAQEAFLKAYVAFDQFQLGTNFRAWLLRILTNTHINRYRRSRRSPETVAWEEYTLLGERELPTETGSFARPEQEVLAGVPDDVVGPALSELPAEFREAVILSDIHELSYKEISQALNIPLGTVRSRIFRGRKLLRDRLAEYARARRLI